ncbi:MAG: hypothetical protein ACRDNK_12795 [Solirubrobacteraceae bacterium]
MTRADLHRLVDELPEESIEPTAAVLERARNPLWATLQAAPPDDEPLTDEDLAAIAEGRKLPGISLEDLRAENA